MEEILLLKSNEIPSSTLANLEGRDVGLWLIGLPTEVENLESIVKFTGLPWRLVLFTGHDRALVRALSESTNLESPMSRKRGFMHLIDADATRIALPPRSLPIFLLDGNPQFEEVSNFERTFRRMTMLEELRRSNVREVLVLTFGNEILPEQLSDLWSSDFRTQLTVVSNAPEAEVRLRSVTGKLQNLHTVTLVNVDSKDFPEEFLEKYFETYQVDTAIVRLRDMHGRFHNIDITSIDEIERPVLDNFSLIEAKDIVPLVPSELTENEFTEFFKDSQNSWRPYAAGLPWDRHPAGEAKLRSILKRLDTIGSDENCVAYISSEPGAGGTTLARHLAWRFAKEGYPVLVANPYMFVPNALSLVNFLTRANRAFDNQLTKGQINETLSKDHSGTDTNERLYETPWIILFDTLHWQHRDSELQQFRNELTRSGRPVCILVVTGTVLGLHFLNGSVFKSVIDLNHAITLEEAHQLGEHLNQFLSFYGKSKTRAQWQRFYEEHNVRMVEGIAAFWVTLSFWLQGQYDISESIQQWIYSTFKKHSEDVLLQQALLQIAAMSSERLPLPQALLPKSNGRWAAWQILEDNLSELSSLGLIRINAQGSQYWALVHDILGRLLINALFHDYPVRERLGFSEANDSEHLRFLILKQISENPRLAEIANKSIADEFATEIFKIDPDRGKANFTLIWEDVLNTLDNMPRILRDTSRVFRHHTAISRRRIAKLDSRLYSLSSKVKISLLEHAIEDLQFALTEIPFEIGSETDLNLLNSLAHAYFDLAEVKAEAGASATVIKQLRQQAYEATQRAYRQSPNNSFVIETYVRSLLQSAQDFPENALEHCVTALGSVYSAIHANIENSRIMQLERLADKAITILFSSVPKQTATTEPRNATEVLVHAWLILASNRDEDDDWSPTNAPIEDQRKALEILSHKAGQGNLQVIQMQYDLVCNCDPNDFNRQIELLESLHLSDYGMSPQLRLEYAILLFQNGRFTEGTESFHSLRRLWKSSDQFVAVPDRLRWLREQHTMKRKIVTATISSDYGASTFAIVREFSNSKVPFRPEEHSLSNVRPGTTFRSLVSFGHNGPFLRPLTA